MKFFLPLLICLTFTSWSQVKLVIEDQLNQGFFLGVNGYLQNEEKASQVLITGLDTNKFELTIRTGSTEFSKPVQLRESGVHKYIITKDFQGHTKLRYRGLLAKTPASTTTITLASSIKWPPSNLVAATSTTKVEDLAPSKAVQDSLPINLEETLEPVRVTAGKSVADGAAAVSVVTISTSSVADSTVDKTGQTSPKAELVVQESDNSDFNPFITNLESQEFEFERLQRSIDYTITHGISAEQLGEIFQILKYDQSRMQLTRQIYPQVKDPDNLESLVVLFEYEITKSKYILYLDAQ